jgi:hypothetical protein
VRSVSPGEGAEGLGAIGGARSHPGTVEETVPAGLLDTPGLQRLLRQSPSGPAQSGDAADDHVVYRSILDTRGPRSPSPPSIVHGQARTGYELSAHKLSRCPPPTSADRAGSPEVMMVAAAIAVWG